MDRNGLLQMDLPVQFLFKTSPVKGILQVIDGVEGHRESHDSHTELCTPGHQGEAGLQGDTSTPRAHLTVLMKLVSWRESDFSGVLSL